LVRTSRFTETVPLDRVIRPTPATPIIVDAEALVTVSCPPVTHTVPTTPPTSPKERFDDNTVVPPAIVNVPCEPAVLATCTSRAIHVPLDTAICPVPPCPTYELLFVPTTCPPVTHAAPVDKPASPTLNPPTVLVP